MSNVNEFDPVARPLHYNTHPSGIEAIQVCQYLDFCSGNAFKYLFRHRDKANPLEDLRKCRWYLERASEIVASGDWFDDSDGAQDAVDLVQRIAEYEQDARVGEALIAIVEGYCDAASDAYSDAICLVQELIDELQ